MRLLHGSIRPSRITDERTRFHDPDLHPTAAPGALRARFPHAVGRRGPSRPEAASLRENDGIVLIIASEEFPAKPGEPKDLRAFCLRISARCTNDDGDDDECDDPPAGMAGAPPGTEAEIAAPAARIPAVRERRTAGQARADRERPRALRRKRARGDARVVDGVMEQ